MTRIATLAVWIAVTASLVAQEPVRVSGIYPHLAYFNEYGECGTGAVVPWAGRLWVITYPPHRPYGSTDKLYEISPDLEIRSRAESVGGTHAGRMIHEESNQLFIGPYAIDAKGSVRAIRPRAIPGRLTGVARHLSDPTRKLLYATMEEGIYEVDVRTLAVKELFADDNEKGADRRRADLPGYHGKGLYSGQGVLVYANNGERGREAQRRPDVPSGCLAEWDGSSETWHLVRRNQFTEVSGPGSLRGNGDSARDPIWSIGWDHKSLLLMLRDAGAWHAYRLPKASHCYDGAHGWNTEWPRIRDIGEEDLLMTMHGAFWRFPRHFASKRSAGIAPRTSYLKVIGDFCRWNDQLVMGCDDTARNEFLNKRRAKGDLAGPGQSHSNLWFVSPETVDRLGPALGRGAIWLEEEVSGDTPSDPFLFSGFDHRGVHLAHGATSPRTFTFEVDATGDGSWSRLRQIVVPARGYVWTSFQPGESGAWIRLRLDRSAPDVTAFFSYSDRDPRGSTRPRMFDGLARTTTREQSGGLLRVRGGGLGTLAFVARRALRDGVSDPTFYELDGALRLRRRDDPVALAWTANAVRIPTDVLTVDAASVLYVDDDGKRWRLPKGRDSLDRPGPFGPARVDREVVTERDLFHAAGTFYELPARNAGGFAKIRPIATHDLGVHDYASFRGLLVMSGVRADAANDDQHIIRSDDGETALWVGVVDDLWKLGKPRGVGGPWHQTTVDAGTLSDPYLLTGFDRKSLELVASEPTTVVAEVDITGSGCWRPHRSFQLNPDQRVTYRFPDGFQAYWIRFRTTRSATLTTKLLYE